MAHKIANDVSCIAHAKVSKIWVIKSAANGRYPISSQYPISEQAEIGDNYIPPQSI